MEISRNSWKEFKDALARMSEKAANEMTAWLERNGGYESIARERVLDMAYALATKYGEASGALSALYYDAIAALEKASVPPAEVAATASYNTVAKSIQGAAKTSTESKYLGGVVGRLSKQVGADTTLQNALRDGAQWAWIPSGDTCAFCITLASRGWQTASEKALKNGHAEHIHANCDCTYAVRFDSTTTVEGYDPDAYAKMYYDADGSTPTAKINSMRREIYAENAEEINAQKRDAYEKRKERESSAAEELNV